MKRGGILMCWDTTFLFCDGALGVGKTSLMRVFSGDEFSESMLATAGYVAKICRVLLLLLANFMCLTSVDFKLRHINVADEAITLQIWDTAGQERFHRITASTFVD